MRKSYHFSREELTNLIKEYFAQKGETISNIDFKVANGANYNGWNIYPSTPYLEEAIIYLKERESDESASDKSQECSTSSESSCRIS